ncbi:hypothetical protein BDV24DRAFT_126709 [Aspergillus arachidicola]|uniref:Uncharacterized protein n=1 Tax=Aspergillus arachidicola TaxID=656916 RepID=A0A5N6YGH8_9EURO|nr:hypothetical protein BDV24DRAFT_126709 [Aspergillus arachidicola]
MGPTTFPRMDPSITAFSLLVILLVLDHVLVLDVLPLTAAVHGIPDAVGGRVIGTVCGKLVSSLL